MRQMYGVKVSVLTWGGPVRGGESAEVIVSAKKCGGEGLNDRSFQSLRYPKRYEESRQLQKK